MAKDLFRKVSLERLTSPEQLDKLLVIVRIRGWLALLTLLVITAGILVWSFLGQIPISATGQGILLDPRGLHGVYSPVEGRVTRIQARTGANVTKGELLVVMENTMLQVKLDEAHRQIDALHIRLRDEQALFDEQKGIKEAEEKRKLQLETLILENQKEKLALLEKQLAGASLETKPNLEKEILEQKSLIEAQMTTIEIFHSKQKIEKTNEKINALKLDLFEAEAKLRRFQTELDSLKVTAPNDGKVIEIDVMLGREVPPGTPLVWIQAHPEKGETLPFYSFVPISMGEKITPGMRAHISLIAIDAQKYGQIVGKVLRVLPYATSLSAQQLAGIPSRVLREYLKADPTAILVVIQPERDPDTPTGYKWTTAKGPPMQELLPGATGTTRIILESKRPITYVLPILTEK